MPTTDDELPSHLQHLEDTTSFFQGEYNAQSVTVTICCALAVASAFELLLLIFTTFRRYGGLYFWALVVATAGILPYTVCIMYESSPCHPVGATYKTDHLLIRAKGSNTSP